MLQIKNLSKSYGAKKAVSNLSFVVEDGDIMGFIGKNGAGKTTTLKACLGIIGIDEVYSIKLWKLSQTSRSLTILRLLSLATFFLLKIWKSG